MWVKLTGVGSMKDFCTLCHWEFSTGHGGENDLTRHTSTGIHKKATLAKSLSNINTFFVTSTVENERIAATEALYASVCEKCICLMECSASY